MVDVEGCVIDGECNFEMGVGYKCGQVQKWGGTISFIIYWSTLGQSASNERNYVSLKNSTQHCALNIC